MFGGLSTHGGFTTDTWTWDGANWTQVASPASPMGRWHHSMAFDAMRGETVLFGGYGSGSPPTYFSDTWVWDGSAWHQKFTPTPPAARSDHVLAYHPALGAVVMIGGVAIKDVTSDNWAEDYRRETWMWTGEEWVQQFPQIQPGPAEFLAAAYDDTKQALTLQVPDDMTCLSRGPKTFLLKAQPAADPGGGIRPPARGKR
jgi:hypothetical protein